MSRNLDNLQNVLPNVEDCMSFENMNLSLARMLYDEGLRYLIPKQPKLFD